VILLRHTPWGESLTPFFIKKLETGLASHKKHTRVIILFIITPLAINDNFQLPLVKLNENPLFSHPGGTFCRPRGGF